MSTAAAQTIPQRIAAEIVRVAKVDPNVSVASLQEDLARSDMSGWSRLPSVNAGSYADWTVGMSLAIEQLQAVSA